MKVLVAVRDDSVVEILNNPSFFRRAYCKREDGDRCFWATVRLDKDGRKYIMSNGQRHYLVLQEVRK